MRAEVAHYVPEPSLFLTGCQAWPPPADPTRPGVCPVCRGGIRPDHHTHYCGVCDAMSPRNEARCLAQRVGVAGRTGEDAARQRARAALMKKRHRLSEALRRQIWNGYRGSIGSEAEGLTNLAREGRDFLTSIGQEPDWSLILDGRGKVVGRYRPAAEPEPGTGTEAA